MHNCPAFSRIRNEIFQNFYTTPNDLLRLGDTPKIIRNIIHFFKLTKVLKKQPKYTKSVKTPPRKRGREEEDTKNDKNPKKKPKHPSPEHQDLDKSPTKSPSKSPSPHKTPPRTIYNPPIYQMFPKSKKQKRKIINI